MRRTVWLTLSQTKPSTSFETQLQERFGDHPPATFTAPHFGSDLDLTKHFLGPEQQLNLEFILLLVAHSFPEIIYSPAIPQITAILLLYLNPNDTYALLSNLLRSRNYFLLNRRAQVLNEVWPM